MEGREEEPHVLEVEVGAPGSLVFVWIASLTPPSTTNEPPCSSCCSPVPFALSHFWSPKWNLKGCCHLTRCSSLVESYFATLICIGQLLIRASLFIRLRNVPPANSHGPTSNKSSSPKLKGKGHHNLVFRELNPKQEIPCRDPSRYCVFFMSSLGSTPTLLSR